MYVDVRFYRKVFRGSFCGKNVELMRLLELASVKANELTFGRIGRFGFEGLTEFQQECVRQAVCFQADYYAKNGIENGEAIRSYRALDVSVWYDRGGQSYAKSEGFSEMGYMFLERSGLCARVER